MYPVHPSTESNAAEGGRNKKSRRDGVKFAQCYCSVLQYQHHSRTVRDRSEE